MPTQWLRRGWLLAACASVLLLAACGGGSIVSQFTPTRVVAFGDAMGDLGQNGNRYTVNDGSNNNWTYWVANAYGRTLAPTASGGTSYAIGNARVTATPDAAGNAATPTVQQQIDAFLAAGGPAQGDLIIVSAGTSDVIAEVQAVLTGAETQDQMLANLAQAGKDLGAQVRRLVDAGASHVVVAGPYNLGRSAWALQTSQKGLMESASLRFNDQFLISVVDLGSSVLYVDAALYYNLVTGSPGGYAMTDVSTPVCTSVDPGPGIGTGTGQVNSNLCTTATLVTPGMNYEPYLFADRVYFTPHGQRLFGDYAYSKIHDRW